MRCFILRIVCTVLVVFMYDTTENVWTDVYKEVADLLAPTPNQLSQMGPKSHPLEISHVGVPPVKPVLKRSSTGYLPNNVPVRAEGCCRVLPRQRESEHVVPDETLKQTSFRKCSWWRAARRAARFGRTRYRGRWLKITSFPPDMIQACKNSLQARSTVSRHLSSTAQKRSVAAIDGQVSGQASLHGSLRHLQFASLNVGGLGSSKLDEALSHAEATGISLLCLQETRWKESRTWTSGPYKVIHSGEQTQKQSYGGVLVAVSLSVEVRYAEVYAGRILRAQLCFGGDTLPLEVVCVYVPPLDDSKPERLPQRHEVWNSLDMVLASIPRRHLLVVLGDFNTCLPRHPPEVPCRDPSGRNSPDDTDLLTIMQQHELSLANTRTGRAGITYQQGSSIPPLSGSRLDLCLVRTAMLCCCTMNAPCWRVPYNQLNEFGCHALLSGNLVLKWRPWRRTTLPDKKRIIDKSLIADAQAPTHPLHQQFVGLLHQKLASAEGSCSESDSYSLVNMLVRDLSLQIFGVPAPPRPVPHWMSPMVRASCLEKWNAFHAVRALTQPRCLLDYLRCWQLVVKLLRTSKSYKRQCKQARNNWIHKICTNAASKVAANDSSFYHLLRLLSPRRPRRAIGITKMLDGTNSVRDEGHKLCAHFSNLFGAVGDSQTLSKLTWQWQQGCPEDAESLAKYLQQVPLHKSIPTGCASGAAWRIALHVPEVRQCVFDLAVRFPLDGIHESFRSGKLVLLAKPGKSGRQVDHFRPLVLQCPLGKLLLRWFVDKLVLEVKSRLLATPQFAYLAGRSTNMAIYRIVTFLEHRKRLAGSPQPSPHLLHAGFIQKPCTGCLVISLDLRQAFDRVSRPRLMSYLQKMGVSLDLIGIMHSWHLDNRYLLEHGKTVYEILSSRGVRQGCTAAPTLWLIYLYNILIDLDQVAPLNWTEIVTAFADDLIFCFPIDQVDDVALVLSYARSLLSYLGGHGLLVNQDKTQVLFKLYGSRSSRLWREYTYLRHGQRRLRLSSDYEPVLVESLEYLGVKLAWSNCGDAVVKSRMHKACGAFALLRPWWRSSALSSACKAKIYKTMVLPVLLYGLGSCGASHKGAARLSKLMVKQLRSVFRSPVHLTRESDLDFVKRVGFLPPQAYLLISCCRFARQILPELNDAAFDSCNFVTKSLTLHLNGRTSWARCLLAGLHLLLPDKVAREHFNIDVGLLRDLLAGLPRRHLLHGWLERHVWKEAPIDAACDTSPAVALVRACSREFACQSCGKTFLSLDRLRTHQYKKDCGWEERKVQTYLPAVDARAELPACHWCGARFERWHGVKMHISLGQCPEIKHRQDFLAQPVCSLPYYLDQDLSSHCVLCKRWFKFPRSLSRHLKASHRSAYDTGMEAYRSLDLKTYLLHEGYKVSYLWPYLHQQLESPLPHGWALSSTVTKMCGPSS